MIRIPKVVKSARLYGMLFLFVLAITLISVLAACNGVPTSVRQNQAVESTPQVGYPAGNGALPQEGYPVGPMQNSLSLAQTPETPLDPPAPEQGKAAISGVLYSYTISRNLPNTNFYLTPAIGAEQTDPPNILIGPEQSKGDIIGLTDEQGRFSFAAVPPGNYYLVILTGADWSIAQISDTDFTALLITLAANEQKNLGVVQVP